MFSCGLFQGILIIYSNLYELNSLRCETFVSYISVQNLFGLCKCKSQQMDVRISTFVSHHFHHGQVCKWSDEYACVSRLLCSDSDTKLTCFHTITSQLARHPHITQTLQIRPKTQNPNQPCTSNPNPNTNLPTQLKQTNQIKSKLKLTQHCAQLFHSSVVIVYSPQHDMSIVLFLDTPDLNRREANIPFREDSSRGYDHGTFIPLMISYPQADVPVIQVG